MRALRAFDLQDRVERVHPFARFQGIDVLQAIHGAAFGENPIV